MAINQTLPNVTGIRSSARKLLMSGGALCVVMVIFWFIARYFHLQALRDYPVSTFLAFTLLFAPYWFFGFGAGDALRRILRSPAVRVLAAALLTLPYFVLALPRGDFHWPLAATLVAIAVLSAAALARWQTPGNWADLAVLAVAGLSIDLGLLNTAGPLAIHGATLWPAGLGGFPKMMMANVALYCYLVIKPIDGVGYDLAPRFSDVKIGLRELLFYAPIVLTLGLLLKFIAFHHAADNVALAVPAAWIFTFIFVALPEELFFRGLVQNLLERRLGRTGSLLLASVLFGLSHFNKGAHFNWRYVLLATIAGIFYGRAWRGQKRLFASSITHSSVDTIWSIWFRVSQAF
ncbi:MAG TPA: CPBP family intramembrane glutamic endopeptidase [Candidatus Angelobacter sp.]|nr:CPBP family intramembrane glutamic endopeptidase [Candidatus Angelobacter sp.]